MARPGVEYDDVARVARQLVSQGESPSVQKVRDRLKTGSNTTIAMHLKAWRASLAASKSPALPESVPEDLMNPLDDFWSLAVAKAESNYQKYKEELEAKMAAAESTKDEALAQLAEKNKEFETMRESLVTAETRLQGTEQQLHTLQGEHTVTSSELAHAHAELERTHTLLQTQEQRFESERDQLQNDHAGALQYERERSTSTENRLLQEIDQLRQKAKNLEAELTTQQKDYQTRQELTQQRELALQREIAEVTARNEQLDSMEQQNKQATETMNNQLTAVQEQLSKSLDTVEALRKAFGASKENEIQLAAEIGRLKEINTQLQSAKRG